MKPNFQVSIPRQPSRWLPAGAANTFSKAAVAAVLAFMATSVSQRVVAQGIPEPILVMYCVVRNAQDNDRLRVVFGHLTWSFQPVGGGPAFAVSATLTNINDQFSYVLRVPCETEIPGMSISPNVLRLGSSY